MLKVEKRAGTTPDSEIEQSSEVSASARLVVNDIPKDTPRLAHFSPVEEPKLQIDNKISVEAQQFREKIVTYMKLGYEVEVLDSAIIYNMEEDELSMIGNDDPFLSKKMGSLRLYMRDDPLLDLEYGYSVEEHIPIEWSKGNGVIEVTPYLIKTSKKPSNDDKTTMGVIHLYDYLDDKHQLIFEREVRLDEDGKVPVEEVEKTIKSLEHLLSSSTEAHKKILNKLVPEREELVKQTTIEMLDSTVLSKTSTTNLKRLFDVSVFVNINILPSNEEFDKFSTSNVMLGGRSIRLDNSKLSKTNYKPFLLDGDILHVDIYREIDASELDRESITIVPPTKSFPREEVIGNEYIDKFGNLVIEEYPYLSSTKLNTDESSLESVEQSILVFPPTAFSTDLAEDSHQKVNIDLSRYGLGEIKDFIHLKTRAPIGVAGDYNIYTNMDPEEVLGDFENLFVDLPQGISAAEKLFGYKPSEKVKNIYIIDSKKPSAGFDKRDPDTILVQDETLRQKLDPNMTTFHETIHLLVHATNNVLLGGDFKRIYDDLLAKQVDVEADAAVSSETTRATKLQLPPAVSNVKLEQFSEKNIMEGITKAGHAQYNTDEFFASFCNITFNNENWGKFMANPNRTLPFLKTNLDALNAIASNVNLAISDDLIPAEAPILRLIETKKAYLTAVIATRGIHKIY